MFLGSFSNHPCFMAEHWDQSRDPPKAIPNLGARKHEKTIPVQRRAQDDGLEDVKGVIYVYIYIHIYIHIYIYIYLLYIYIHIYIYHVITPYSTQVRSGNKMLQTSDQVSSNSLGASCPNNKTSLALSRNFSIIASSFFCKVFLRCWVAFGV